MLSKYRMIYQGLKPTCFYWEFINFLKKVFLVAVNVFLNLYSNIFKALLSLMILFIFLRMQVKLQPYKKPLINELEHREFMTTIGTFFGALFFVNKEISSEVTMIVFLAILLINVWFLLLWLYCFTSTFRHPYL